MNIINNNQTILGKPFSSVTINGKENILIPYSILADGFFDGIQYSTKDRKDMANYVLSEFKDLLQANGFDPNDLVYEFPKSSKGFNGYKKYEIVRLRFKHTGYVAQPEAIKVLFHIDRRSLAMPISINHEPKISYNLLIDDLNELNQTFISQKNADVSFLKKIFWDLQNFDTCFLANLHNPNMATGIPTVKFNLDGNTFGFEFTFPARPLQKSSKGNVFKAVHALHPKHGGLYQLYSAEERNIAEYIKLLNDLPDEERTFDRVAKLIEYEIFPVFGVENPSLNLSDLNDWNNDPLNKARKARVRKEKIESAFNF